MSRYYLKPDAEPLKEKEPELRKKFKSKKGIKTFKQNNTQGKHHDPFPGPAPIPDEALKKYRRGKRINTDGIKVRRFKSAIIQNDKKIQLSVKHAARAEILLPEEPGYLEAEEWEDTHRISQQEIVANVDITSSTKFFSLTLADFGPYRMNYSRDGRHLLLGGRLGHLAAMDWLTKRLVCEINVMESIHDVCWLHIPTMFAAAQKKWVHIYDNLGLELHCIKKLNRVLHMEFLPYHFLLVSASEKGFLSWLDISVGKMVTETYTNTGRLGVLSQNPCNALVLTGHPNGTVSMWSPNLKTPVVRMLCHPHPIRAVAVDPRGNYLATAGVDRLFKIWDIRNYKCLQSYKLGSAAGFLNFSQQGLLCVGHGNVVEIYKDCCTQAVDAPYMRHKVSTTLADIQFCPYEDVLGIGHNRGFTSILVPGAGEPNFDAFESNPFMTKSQRREMEVKALLEKIPHDLITENPGHLGSVNVKMLKEQMEKKKEILYVKPREIEFEPRRKSKGRSKTAKTFKRKKGVQEEQRRKVIKQMINKKKPIETNESGKRDVLRRFKSASK